MGKKKKTGFLSKLKKMRWKKWLAIAIALPVLFVLSLFLLVRFGGLGDLPSAV